MFIASFTSVGHLSLSWASSIQSMPPHPTSWKSILILSSHLRLGLPSGLFPSGFPTETLYTPLLSPIRATCPAHNLINSFIHLKTKGPIRALFQGRNNTPVSTSNAGLLSKKFKFEISLGQNGKTVFILKLSHPHGLYICFTFWQQNFVVWA